MNGVELLDKMSDIDAGLILESESCGKKASKKKPIFIGAGVVAAAAAVALTVNFIGNTGRQLPVSENLPVLTVSGTITVGGMGFEGFDIADISDYENGNPWTPDMNIKVMPVYKSNVGNPDKEKITEYLLSTAEKFGIDTNTLEIEAHNFGGDEEFVSLKKAMEEQNVPPEEIEAEINRVKTMMLQQANIYAANDDLYLSADGAYTVGVVFNDDSQIILPEEYRDVSTEEGRLNTAKYLLEQYKDIQGLTNPVVDIYKDGSIGFYDKGETDAETIFNYSLNHSRFGIDQEGYLHAIWLDSTIGCEKIGNYPIISKEEAEQELLSGNYLTTAPYDLQEGDKPAYVEIIYRMDRGCDYALPYYRFLVEMPEEYEHNIEDNKTCYGAYYVCAVGKEYISNPTISFNGVPIGQNGLEK